jgi:hypothetical protein
LASGANGLEHFHELTGRDPLSFDTPIASTPRGGLHLYLLCDGARFSNCQRLAGLCIDVRGHNGYTVAPAPGNGRRWIKPPTGPWSPAPEAVKREFLAHKAREKARKDPENRASGTDYFSAFAPSGLYRGDTPRGSATLAGVCDDIRNAPNTHQEDVFHRKAFKIGCLISEGHLGLHAIDAVIQAALAMPNFQPNRPWIPKDIITKARRSIEAGMTKARR